MIIDWDNFTPWTALYGGLLIGAAASLFALLNGRILGISGILGGMLLPKPGDFAWRVSFLAGLATSAAFFMFFGPQQLSAAPQINSSYTLIIIAGLLVGIGTRCGSGCTSGHGVCGLSRLSPRSLVATLSFMGAGFVTVYLLRHVF